MLTKEQAAIYLGIKLKRFNYLLYQNIINKKTGMEGTKHLWSKQSLNQCRTKVKYFEDKCDNNKTTTVDEDLYNEKIYQNKFNLFLCKHVKLITN